MTLLCHRDLAPIQLLGLSVKHGIDYRFYSLWIAAVPAFLICQDKSLVTTNPRQRVYRWKCRVGIAIGRNRFVTFTNLFTFCVNEASIVIVKHQHNYLEQYLHQNLASSANTLYSVVLWYMNKMQIEP